METGSVWCVAGEIAAPRALSLPAQAAPTHAGSREISRFLPTPAASGDDVVGRVTATFDGLKKKAQVVSVMQAPEAQSRSPAQLIAKTGWQDGVRVYRYLVYCTVHKVGIRSHGQSRVLPRRMELGGCHMCSPKPTDSLDCPPQFPRFDGCTVLNGNEAGQPGHAAR